MLKCIIIDDDKSFIALLSDYINTTPGLTLVDTYCDPVYALSKISVEDDIDILFLDIEMPGLSGLDMVLLLYSKVKFIIVVTAHAQHAVKAFELPIDDYLLKPFSLNRFHHAIEKINRLNLLTEKKEQVIKHDFFIKSIRHNNKLVNCRYSDVIAFEIKGKELLIHTEKEKLSTYISMNVIENELANKSNFIRIHRSFIISKSHIDKIEENTVTLKPLDLKITIGDIYRKNFNSYINSKILRQKKVV